MHPACMASFVCRKLPEKYPAILKVPGAGIRAYNGEPERAGNGFIILEIGIHGIPVNLTGGCISPTL